jgi:hypothetical protein
MMNDRKGRLYRQVVIYIDGATGYGLDKDK